MERFCDKCEDVEPRIYSDVVLRISSYSLVLAQCLTRNSKRM